MEATVPDKLPPPDLQRNDRKARILIWTVSIIVFIAVAFLAEIKLNIHLSFDPAYFCYHQCRDQFNGSRVIGSRVACRKIQKILPA